MAHIFKYAILMAIPDRLRGERVNVGILVFLKERVDIWFPELSKIRALMGGDWDAYAADARRRMVDNLGGAEQAEGIVRSMPKLDPVFQASDVSWFSIPSLEEYEVRVKEILSSLVIRPKEPPSVKPTRINAEMSKQLRMIKVLASRNHTIDNHKVVRNFYISREEELIADFALKNGSMHIFATLDLRRASVRIDEAALKAITLNQAKKRYKNKKTNLIGVYATSETGHQFKPHIELLKEYSTNTYNWSNADDRMSLIGAIRRAAVEPFAFGKKAS